MALLTTADLPAAFRADQCDPALLRAVRQSGLRLDSLCRDHNRVDCPTCLVAAARALVAAGTHQEVRGGRLRPTGAPGTE
jgi:hypothetical protein